MCRPPSNPLTIHQVMMLKEDARDTELVNLENYFLWYSIFQIERH